jgi:ribokinase
MKIITIGSALIDVFIQSKDFSKDDEGRIKVGNKSGKSEVESFVVKSGGGGGNTAVGFTRLGFEVEVISETGHDELAELILQDFKKEGVATNLVVQERKEETGGSVILVCDDGSRSVLVHRGAASMLDPADIRLRDIEDADWIHISSLSGRLDTLGHLFGGLRHHRLKTSWNPGSADLKLISEGKLKVKEIECEVFLVNNEEWQLIANKQEELKAHLNQIVITDSVRGGKIMLKGGEKIIYKSEKVEAVDHTGAGDAFGVGYVAGLLHRKSPEEAAQWGAKNSASVVMKLGAKAGLKKKLG